MQTRNLCSISLDGIFIRLNVLSFTKNKHVYTKPTNDYNKLYK
ncbi:hypothetical protein HMPREF3232_00940 [Fannyhessea vaginae]|nr:hypothetical protein HMPREF3232_00940 [Fannyhessea vaginae]